ncbi:MAG: hypothetical protein ACU0CI_03215 [Shimia sp.]
MTPLAETPEEDGLAGIAVAVAFLGAVLMLFAFVTFAVLQGHEATRSVGQQEPGLTAPPPAWSELRERNGFALLSSSGLTIFDMGVWAEALADPASAPGTAEAYLLPADGRNAAVEAFSLTVVAGAAIPDRWVAASLILGPEAPCTDLPTRLTVWVLDDAGDLAPLLALAERCGTRLRLEPVGDQLRRLLRLDPRDFSAAGMFR